VWKRGKFKTGIVEIDHEMEEDLKLQNMKQGFHCVGMQDVVL
jgi:hypothetical protein